MKTGERRVGTCSVKMGERRVGTGSVTTGERRVKTCSMKTGEHRVGMFLGTSNFKLTKLYYLLF